ncbi:hypothetical protein QBC36DRAFT_240352 [Triangularia setosa]|uniref:Glycosyltransferase family 31 protein n=1 Tax=Triangularia setosa TaxID=2587417 RepID=A0AAN7A808_9PEZI|nr:hypothetical protein QBC36DRAFT_240352 [Podospora setosa]
MMLAPRCFSRVTLVLLSVILGLLLFTTLRVHNGIPPTVSITAAQSMVENLAGEWFHLDRQHPDKVSPFTPQVDNGAEEQKPPELLVEGKASRHLARPPELEYLRQEKFGLTDTIVYTQHCIKPVYDKTINRTLITNITSPFISDRSTISLTLSSDPPVSLPDCAPLLLPVPPPYRKTPHPELIFGVASTYSRLSSPATLSAFAHWLSHSKSRLILTITDYHSLPPSSTLSSLSKLYSSHSILATCLPPPVQSKSYTTSQLHFLLLPTLLSFSTPQTTFLSLVDDDTFFPALHPLSAALSRFNPSLPLYLGAKSDSQSANGQYGEMAFGGAGVFISVPLAKMLVPYYELCAAGGGGDYRALGGDGILRDCVYNFTETRLTEVRGLWQGDVRGDAKQPSSAPPLLSLHHWRSWFHAPVDKMAGVNEVCGDCFLQRWRTGVGENETGSSDSEKRKGLWVNGYSYTEYSPGSFPTEEDLQKVEGTWLYAEEGDYEDAYGPLRQRLGEGEKKQWLLVDAYWTRDGKGWRGQKKQFRQLYVYHAPRVLTGEEKENKEAVDEVLEVVWDI